MIATLKKVSQASPSSVHFCRKDASEKTEDLRYFADYHPGDPPVTCQPENCMKETHVRESYPGVPVCRHSFRLSSFRGFLSWIHLEACHKLQGTG